MPWRRPGSGSRWPLRGARTPPRPARGRGRTSYRNRCPLAGRPTRRTPHRRPPSPACPTARRGAPGWCRGGRSRRRWPAPARSRAAPGRSSWRVARPPRTSHARPRAGRDGRRAGPGSGSARPSGPPSLALRGVGRLGGLLVGCPPVAVVGVPGDGVGEALLEVAEPRLPVELEAELAGLDRVALVVAGAVGDQVVVVLGPAEQPEQQAHHLEVVALT